MFLMKILMKYFSLNIFPSFILTLIFIFQINLNFKSEVFITFATAATDVNGSNAITFIKEGALSSEEVSLLEKIEQEQINLEEMQGIPNNIRGLPNEGDKNGFGITISSEIKAIYKNMYEGNATEALHTLEKISASNNNGAVINKWFLSTLKAQILLLLDRAADAEIELTENTSKFENEYFAHNLTSIALRGETRLWLNDLKNSKRDFAKVLLALKDWQLPTSFMGPPSEPEKMYNLASVQLRATVGMAAVYSATGDLNKAYPWAKRAENAFSRIQYVTNHPLFGSMFPPPPDLYYGRGMNLGLLAACTLVTTKDLKKSKEYLDLSLKFFDKINYPMGKVITQALKAQAYKSIDMPDEANKLAKEALVVATKYLWSNLIWRIETLRAGLLIKLNKPQEAKLAYRNAQAAVELVSGNLETDRSKVRFGVGKEDITYNLIKFDVTDKDYNTLFIDLERGRARAFVDMLGSRNVKVDDNDKSIVGEITKLSQQLRVLSLVRNAPNASSGTSGVNSGDKTKSKDINTEEEKIRKLRQQKINELQKTQPELASIFEIQSPSLKTVKESLSASEGIIYFLPLKDDENIQILLIDKNKIEIVTLASKLKEIRDNIFDLNDEFSSGNLEGQKQKIKILGEKLNIDKIIKNKINYIVPSKDIFFVPWGALDISNPVSVIPMGSWILQSKNTKNSSSKAVVIGNPEFAGAYPQLQGAETEAKNIAEIYNVPPLIGKEATLKNIMGQIGDGCKVLHLSTHGIFNVSRPLDSAIILSDGEKALPLTAEMLVTNPLKAQVVILSACETGMGKAMSGDDFVGITRSFYLGGAKTILYSLRKVDDMSTSTFMGELHKEAQAQKLNFIDAAFLARKKMIEKGFSPSVYGAFVVGGISK